MTLKRNNSTCDLSELTNFNENQFSLVKKKCFHDNINVPSLLESNSSVVTGTIETQINSDTKPDLGDDSSYLDKWQKIFHDCTNTKSLDELVLNKQKHFDIDSDLFTEVWRNEKSNFITQMNQSFNDYIVNHEVSNSFEKFQDFHENGISKEIRLLLNPCQELEVELSELEAERLKEAKEVWGSLKSYIETHKTEVINKRSKLESKVEKLSMLSKQINKVAEKFTKFK